MVSLTITNNKELYRLPVDNIVCVAADGNYSMFTMTDQRKHTVILKLGEIEEMLGALAAESQSQFVRVGKSVIINLNYVLHVAPTRKCMVLSDCRTFELTLSASQEALSALKRYLES